MNPTVRLLAPSVRAARAPSLDPSQRRAVDAGSGLAAGAALVVVGAPGTGKTTVAVETAVAALEGVVDPSEVLVLSATRRSAARVRDVLTARAGRTLAAPLVRTPASAAFALLSSRAAALGEPAPTLVSGPEQDFLLSELLAGHAAGEGVDLALPAGLPDEVLGLRGFRQELRDLLMRAAEHDLQPADLDALGQANGRPEWVLAAQLYDEYLAVNALGAGTPDRGARYDPAVVVAEAAQALRTWDDVVPGAERPRWRLVVVDDYQEATAATAGLLDVLRADGASLVLLGDPDVAVQTFRGASPGLLAQAVARPAAGGSGTLGAGTREAGAFDAELLTLDVAWRHGPSLRGAVSRTAAAIPTSGLARHRRAQAPAGSGADDVQVATFASDAEQVAFVARALREEHLLHGTPWDAMAVLARSGSALASLRRGLLAASVPVALLGSEVPLREEPAVRPLLAVVELALDAEEHAVTEAMEGGEQTPWLPEQEVVAELLTSPVGGLDVVGLRRLRRALRAEEKAGGGGRASDVLLAELVLDPSRTATLPAGVRASAAAVARVVAETRAAARLDGADAQSVLWVAWSAAGLAERWQRTALDGGPAGARADRDLDSVLALFRAAETFVDRLPQARVRAFLEYLASQDLPADTLAAQASGEGSVAALTPAGAAGSEWDVVIVADVQDGTWPDLRLRDSLLGSQALVEVIARREVPGVDDSSGASARRAVLADELRAFVAAVSRARRRLVVTAVDDADESPSVFCDLLDPPPADGRKPIAVAAPLDLRGLVASLRRGTIAGAPGHAVLLADLVRADVQGADPRSWYGANEVSSDAELVPEGRVTVSPSKVEQVDECALKWALESAGGTAPDATSQTLGTLVHSIAESLPSGNHHELAAELRRRFPELGLRPGWPATHTMRQAEAMIERLAGYVAGREVVAVEAPFELDVGERAHLRGVIDRLEVGPRPGTVEVVDLKTGKQAPAKPDMPRHPQLGAYQLAVDSGGLDEVAGIPVGARSAGGSLVYVGSGTNATLRDQPALDAQPDEGRWAAELVDKVAQVMAGSAFVAQENKLCRVCPVRRACPIQPDGRQVIA